MNTKAHPATIRCSALPEAFLCPGAIRGAEILIDPVSGAADLGTAAHLLMADVVTNDRQNTAGLDVEGVAKRFGVDRDELGVMAWRGVNMWRDLRGAFVGARAESRLEAELESVGVVLTGHLDLYALYPEQRLARLLDWKTGRVDRDYAHQVVGYATLILLSEPDIDQVDMVIGWLREGEIERYTVARRDMTAWIDRLRQEVLAWDGVYRPGGHCGFCARSHDCPALVAMARRDLAILSDPELTTADNGLASLSGPEVVALHRKERLLSRMLESFHELVRLRVPPDGLDSGDGKVLKVVEENGRREIDTEKAWPLLQGRLDDKEMAAVVSVSARALDETIAAKAGKGRGAAAKREIAEALRAVDAITQSKVLKLKEVRK